MKESLKKVAQLKRDLALLSLRKAQSLQRGEEAQLQAARERWRENRAESEQAAQLRLREGSATLYAQAWSWTHQLGEVEEGIGLRCRDLERSVELAAREVRRAAMGLGQAQVFLRLCQK